jgi:hypothetical protein
MRHSDPRLTASVYTDEKLPLAARFGSAPAIPGDDGKREAAFDLEVLTAKLTRGQRQALLGMLRRLQAG